MVIFALIILCLYGFACVEFNAIFERFVYSKQSHVDKMLNVMFLLTLILLFAAVIGSFLGN
jgi:hypothetical protein